MTNNWLVIHSPLQVSKKLVVTSNIGLKQPTQARSVCANDLACIVSTDGFLINMREAHPKFYQVNLCYQDLSKENHTTRHHPYFSNSIHKLIGTSDEHLIIHFPLDGYLVHDTVQLSLQTLWVWK